MALLLSTNFQQNILLGHCVPETSNATSRLEIVQGLGNGAHLLIKHRNKHARSHGHKHHASGVYRNIQQSLYGPLDMMKVSQFSNLLITRFLLHINFSSSKNTNFSMSKKITTRLQRILYVRYKSALYQRVLLEPDLS